jgi:hypothetical protein
MFTKASLNAMSKYPYTLYETIYNTCHTKVDTHQPNPKNIRVIHET